MTERTEAKDLVILDDPNGIFDDTGTNPLLKKEGLIIYATKHFCLDRRCCPVDRDAKLFGQHIWPKG